MTDEMTRDTGRNGGARRRAAAAAWMAALLTALGWVGAAAGAGAAAPGAGMADTGAAPPGATAGPRTSLAVAAPVVEVGAPGVPPVVTAVMALAPPHGFGAPVADGGLALQRGGAALPSSEMKLDGVVGNNAATNVVTGANIISDGAFSNASGLPMVIQNSGANVLIQNATIVNVQFQ
jgi:hypothetical protein